MQIPSQELMTKDIVTIHVDAVAFYKIDGPLKALCDVEDGDGASSEAAQVRVISVLEPYSGPGCRTRFRISDWT